MAGLALAVRYLAGGRYELAEAAPIGAGTVLGTGLAVAVGSGVAGLLFGGSVLDSVKVDLWLPLLGHFEFVTSLFFDIGVYLVRGRAGAGHAAQPRRRGGPAHRGERRPRGPGGRPGGDRT